MELIAHLSWLNLFNAADGHNRQHSATGRRSTSSAAQFFSVAYCDLTHYISHLLLRARRPVAIVSLARYRSFNLELPMQRTQNMEEFADLFRDGRSNFIFLTIILEYQSILNVGVILFCRFIRV